MIKRQYSAAFIIVAAVLLGAGLSGCNRQTDAEAASQSISGQIDRDAAIKALVHNYEEARGAKQWDLALSYADKLQHLAPGSEAAASVQATVGDTGIHADEVRDKGRLASLWTYKIDPVGQDTDGMVATASILSSDKPDSDASDPDNAAQDAGDSSAAASAKLVLRRHPQLGRGLYVALNQGEFDCTQVCAVQVQFDDQPAHSFAASRSDQNKQALYITDEKTIRENLDKIRVVTINTSVDGHPRSLAFDVGGFDRVQFERQMP